MDTICLWSITFFDSSVHHNKSMCGLFDQDPFHRQKSNLFPESASSFAQFLFSRLKCPTITIMCAPL